MNKSIKEDFFKVVNNLICKNVKSVSGSTPTYRFILKILSTKMSEQDSLPKNSEVKQSLIQTKEGKVILEHGSSPRIFYNPIQEVNRDISILGINTFIKQNEKESVSILEAMAASGIRSIRYAKEISNLSSVIANDYSHEAIESIKKNSELNGVGDIVKASFMDASALMHSQHGAHYVVDLDPYGTPIPFLDAAVQCASDGGLLLVTATDMAVLSGNTPETCYAKYGSMSLKSHACHEMALRILIHAVQSFANRYGRIVEPLISLKVDFYARLLFRVIKNPKRAKETAINTSMVFQCTGCHSLNFQPLAVKKVDAKSNPRYHFAQGPTVAQKCGFCDSSQHIGGPIWTGPIHNKSFVGSMMENLNTSFEYLNTAPRIRGLLAVVLEELDVPLLYSPSQTCSVLKCAPINLLKLRSAFLNLGYSVSLSHTGPDTLKTNAPNKVLWQILCAWHAAGNGGKLGEDSPGRTILARNDSSLKVDFTLHPEANPKSRIDGVLRYQMNPTANWGPGRRNEFDANQTAMGESSKNKSKKRKMDKSKKKTVASSVI